MWETTPEELLQQIAKKDDAAQIRQQTVILGSILKEIANELAKNKSVKVENTVRQVMGKVSVERPEWIKELKLDTNPLEKKLDYIASAIIRKEGVKEVSIKRPLWISELIPKEIKEKEEKDMVTPICDMLKLIHKELGNKVEVVSVKGEVAISKPSWYTPLDISGPIVSFGSFLKKLLDQTVFKATIQNTVKTEVTNQITVANPVKTVTIADMKKVLDALGLISSQLVALGNTGGNAGGSGTAEKQQLTTRIYKEAGFTYIADASPGTASSFPGWRIIRIDATGANLYAEGNAKFEHIADNYISINFQ